MRTPGYTLAPVFRELYDAVGTAYPLGSRGGPIRQGNLYTGPGAGPQARAPQSFSLIDFRPETAHRTIADIARPSDTRRSRWTGAIALFMLPAGHPTAKEYRVRFGRANYDVISRPKSPNTFGHDGIQRQGRPV
jgi:hypothetical protein